jgi:hypothetical protein
LFTQWRDQAAAVKVGIAYARGAIGGKAAAFDAMPPPPPPLLLVLLLLPLAPRKWTSRVHFFSAKGKSGMR